MADKRIKFRAIRSAIALPLVLLTIVPAIILWSTKSFQPGWGYPDWRAYALGALGLLVLGLGLVLLGATIRLFANVGEGTLAPWDPPQKLVVVGPYRYVRNPMHSGAFMALYGEGLLFGSMPLLVFVTVVFVFHWAYIPLMEERWLTNKFGEEYRLYKRNVPRWIPRVTPWQGSKE